MKYPRTETESAGLTMAYARYNYSIPIWLVVWNIFMTFHILGMIIPTDELILFRGVGIPPTNISQDSYSGRELFLPMK